MEPKATIKNKANGVTYAVTRSQWGIIKSSTLGTAYEMVQDFPPLVALEDLPEVKALLNPPEETAPEEPAAPTVEGDPNNPLAEETPAKTGKKKNGS